MDAGLCGSVSFLRSHVAFKSRESDGIGYELKPLGTAFMPVLKLDLPKVHAQMERLFKLSQVQKCKQCNGTGQSLRDEAGEPLHWQPAE